MNLARVIDAKAVDARCVAALVSASGQSDRKVGVKVRRDVSVVVSGAIDESILTKFFWIQRFTETKWMIDVMPIAIGRADAYIPTDGLSILAADALERCLILKTRVNAELLDDLSLRHTPVEGCADGPWSSSIRSTQLDDAAVARHRDISTTGRGWAAKQSYGVTLGEGRWAPSSTIGSSWFITSL